MRIGFIALSGLRICDDNLVALGFSFPGLQSRARQIESLPSLGLLTIAAYCPAHWDLDYREVRDLAEMPRHPDYDVVFLSFLTATAKEAYRWARLFREAGAKVILGGLHVTLCPTDAAPHADAIVIGEGEPVMPTLVNDLEKGALQETYRSADFPSQHWQDPVLPRFDLLDPGKYTRFTVQTQRGCPWHCEFCASSIRLGSGYRVKPIDAVIREIQAIKSIAEDPFIEFADDNTFTDRRHSRKLMAALEKEHVPWFTESDISIADDLDLLRQIKAAGCRQILIGLEATTASALDGVERRRNWKAQQADKYLRAIEIIQSTGITVNGCFVLGLDTQGTEAFDETFDFIERSGLWDVQVTYLTPFPGTPLYQRLSEEGRILVEGATERATLFDINFQPTKMSVDELRKSFHDLTARLYGTAEVKRRRKRFFAQRKSIAP